MYYELEPYSGPFLLGEQQNWLVVPVSQTRDSGHLEKSNFEVACERIADASDWRKLQYEVHRFGHWGPGWYEIILVEPDTPCQSVAQSICDELNNYPVLDEDDWCKREYAEWSDRSYEDVCRILDSEWETLGDLEDNADEFYEAVIKQLPNWSFSEYASDDEIRDAIHTVAATGKFKFDTTDACAQASVR